MTSDSTDTGSSALALVDLGDTHRRLKAIVEAADDGLLACDGSGRLTLVNPAAAALLGIASLPPGSNSEWPPGTIALRLALERALAEGYASTDLEIERGDRTLRIEGRASATISESGEVDGAVLVMHDVTRLRELAAAGAEGWEALAHDLKTPLNSIGGFTTLLLQEAVGPLNPLQRDFLRTIDQEGQRLLQAVHGFLDEARSSEAQEHLNISGLQLGPLVEETIDRTRPLLAQKSLTVGLDLPDDLPQVEADRDKLTQVLLNLLDNAISFSPEGARIEVSGRALDGHLEVCVQDHGPGIPSEALERVFTRFYQAGNQPPAGRPGVGLGLSICKQLVESHGGQIRAEAAPGGGARLTFTLPFRTARQEVGSGQLVVGTVPPPR
jgi:signal transduction histidine kinase